jgi:hypothetical protein
MSDFLMHKNIRLRCKKAYAGAHTHILIGQVVDVTQQYIAVRGWSFHFLRLVEGLKNQIHAGDISTRIIPWENIEIIHKLSEAVNYHTNFTFNSAGHLVLQDAESTVIAERRDGLE